MKSEPSKVCECGAAVVSLMLRTDQLKPYPQLHSLKQTYRAPIALLKASTESTMGCAGGAPPLGPPVLGVATLPPRLLSAMLAALLVVYPSTQACVLPGLNSSKLPKSSARLGAGFSLHGTATLCLVRRSTQRAAQRAIEGGRERSDSVGEWSRLVSARLEARLSQA